MSLDGHTKETTIKNELRVKGKIRADGGVEFGDSIIVDVINEKSSGVVRRSCMCPDSSQFHWHLLRARAPGAWRSGANPIFLCKNAPLPPHARF